MRSFKKHQEHLNCQGIAIETHEKPGGIHLRQAASSGRTKGKKRMDDHSEDDDDSEEYDDDEVVEEDDEVREKEKVTPSQPAPDLPVRTQPGVESVSSRAILDLGEIEDAALLPAVGRDTKGTIARSLSGERMVAVASTLTPVRHEVLACAGVDPRRSGEVVDAVFEEGTLFYDHKGTSYIYVNPPKDR